MASKIYNCLVVDDEPIARKIIANYISDIPFLTVSAECINALNAMEYLRTNSTTDIIFLDINMPNLSGLQLLKIIQPKQPVIFTTAYADHALESYELNVIDYLLKPFSFERFTKAVHKAINVIKSIPSISSETHINPNPDLYIKSDGKNYPVFIDNILYCEAMKNYTIVVLKTGQKLMPLIPLSKLTVVLSDAGGEFIQTHRSFIVAKKCIKSVTANNVMLDQYEIPIGIQFREKFFQAIGMKDHQ